MPVNNAANIAHKISFGTLFKNPARDALSLVNYAFNVLMFAPVGFFAAISFEILFDGRAQKTNLLPLWAFLFCVLLSAFFELAQLPLSYRVTDLDDIILNSAGAALGIFSALILRNKILA